MKAMVALANMTNPEMLREAALLLERENQKLIEKNLELTREILRMKGATPEELQLKLAELERQLKNANKARFGRSTEKHTRKKTTSTEEDAELAQTGHGPTPQPGLAFEEEIHLLDDADKMCPQCGGALAEWEGQFEESELIDVVERTWVVRKVKRQKYRCGCQACIETALGPTMLIPGGRYSPDVAVEIAADKYLDHNPLQRQTRKMKRENFIVTAQTLWDQLEAAASWLMPTYERIVEFVRSHPVIGIDETHWKFLGSNGAEHAQHRWQAWVIAAPTAVAYRILESRSALAARIVLGDFKGIGIVDGYSVYEHLAKEGDFTIANCWAHVRRKFIELENVISTQTRDEILALIAELYAIEDEADGNVEVLARLRRERSRGVITRIRDWLFNQKATELPRGAFAKAIDYALERWAGLTRFVDDARIPIDNNGSERAMRGPVLGRKNHYGSKSQRGTEVAALYYTLFETAKLCDFDPKEFVRSSLHRAINGAPPLLPHELRAALDDALAPPAVDLTRGSGE
jgi:transposase